MNLIGVRAHDYGRAEPEALLAAVAADGWQAVQLAPPKCFSGADGWDGVTPELMERARRALSENNLTAAVYGAYVELGAADEAVRAEAVRVFRAQLPFAKALGAGCVGSETTRSDAQPHVTRAKALACLERSLEAILPDAEALGVTVALEPVFRHTMATPELTRRVLADMASPALRVIFDPANLFSPEDAPRQQALWERAFEAFGERICAVHIKGARIEDGQTVRCPLEESEVDYSFVFRLLRQTGAEPPILREEAVPAHAARDLAFLRALLQ